MKKTILYARVSSEDQFENGFSIDNQKFQLIKYANENQITDYIYLEEQGESATSLNRTQMKKAIKLIENDEVENIVFYKVDRLSRNVYDFAKLSNLCVEHNTKLISLTENLEDSSMGNFSKNMMISLAEMESQRISERTKDGYVGMLESGIYPFGGRRTFGISKTPDRKLEYNDDIEIVKEIFKNDSYGISYQENCRLINAKYKLGKSKNWIQSIVENTLYKGYVDYMGKRYYFLEPIVEENYRIVEKKYQHKRNRIEHVYYLRYVLSDYKKSTKVKTIKKTGEKKIYHYYKNLETGLIYNEDKLMKLIDKNIKIMNKQQKKLLDKRLKKLNEIYVMTDMAIEEYTELKNKLNDKLGILTKIDNLESITIDEFDNVTCYANNKRTTFTYER